MARILKYGGHRYVADFSAVAVSASTTINSLALIYDFNADGSQVANSQGWGTWDGSQEMVNMATFCATATITGAANGATLELIHRSVTGTIVDQVNLAFVSGQNAAAWVPIDLTGPITGNLTVSTGNSIASGWLLSMGDTLDAAWAQGSTGLALPAGSIVQFYIGALGA